jgi:hypothetical protein
MKNKSIFGIVLLTVILGFSTFSCNSGGTSSVTITIDLGLQNAGAFNAPESSIIERMLRFFAKDAEAAAPTHLSSLTLNITGEGMDKITQSYLYPNIPTTITLEVPAGDSRVFEVLADTGSVIFRGTATRHLSGGATVSIPIQMALKETKIIVPDYNNNRIVQIDDMNGTNWISKINTDLGVSNLSPYDIDFDSQGRIYIANNYPATGGGIIRLDNIDDATTVDNMLINRFSVVTVTVDRTNNFLYNATASALYKYNLTTSGETPLTVTGIAQISGLAVDDSGMLYITCSQGGTLRVIKYNPSGTGAIVTGVFYSMGTGTPWDVLYKAPYVYVANLGGAANRNILQLDTNLAFIAGYGMYINTTINTKGDFYGARRFLAIRPREFIIADDGADMDFMVNVDRLIAMDDMTGTNWTTYGTEGTSQDQFRLFYNC